MKIIDGDVPTEVMDALAKALGFHLVYARAPGADEWTISKGHGVRCVHYTGTRRDVAVFLSGYSAMHREAVQLLDDVTTSIKGLDEAVRARLLAMS